MKNNFTTLLTFIIFLFSSWSLMAQPANDKCENATSIMLFADAGSATWTDGDTRMTEDATMVTGTPSVCSGTWYTDDVWYTLDIGANVPSTGIVIETEMGSQADDFMEVGMAVYNSCDASEIAIQCFSNEPGRRTITVQPSCLSPNSSLTVRVWSAGSATDNSGTFRIRTYNNPEPIPVETNTVYFTEDFNSGMNGWTSSTIIGDSLVDVWLWKENGIFENHFGTLTYAVNNPFSACTPSVGFASGFYQYNGGAVNTDSLFAVPNTQYSEHEAELISPDIDLSAVANGVSLKFDQVFHRLNANGATPGGPLSFVSYSIDGGSNWSDPQPINADLVANDAPRDNVVKVPLPGAEGNSNVKVKFIWGGDFYAWVIDRVEIIESDRYEVAALRSSAGNNYGTPMTQLYPVSFLMDVGNDGIATATGVTGNVQILDLDNGNAVVFDEDKNIPDIPPFNINDDSDVAFDNIWAGSYLPPSVPGRYQGVFTVEADSVDANPDNNRLDFEFTVTDSVFRKDLREPLADANLSGILPADPDWTYGAGYYTPNGDGYRCAGITFAISSTDDPQFVGSNISIVLYKWEDVNGDGDAQPEERGFGANPLGGEILGSFLYNIDGSEVNDNIDITVELDPEDGDVSQILLEDGAQYIVAVEMNSPSGVADPVSIVADDEINYLNSWFVNDSLANIDPANYAPQWGAFFSNETGFDATLESDFGFSPRIHMLIAPEIIDNVTDLDKANILEVYPNPATDNLTLDVDLVNSFDNVEVKIVDATGKTMLVSNYQNLWKENLTFDVSNYPSGNYFIHVTTNEGNRALRFAVVK